MRARHALLRGAVATALLAVPTCRAQLQGAPGGVPVPPAPAASQRSSPRAAVAMAADDLHFRVRLLDGRTSLPVKNGHVRLWYDERDSAGYLLTTDTNGIALLPEPAATPVRVLVVPDGLFDCRKLPEREPMPGYNLQQIASGGTLTENHCESGVRATPHAGELTLFARPAHWYEQLNRDMAR